MENTNARLRVPYLGISPTGGQYADTVAAEKFNSLQATLRKQLSHGVTFQAAYTFSRAFSNIVQNGPVSGDPLNLQQQYGLNTQYRPQRLVINYSWDIPYGNLKGVAGKIVGGWNLSGVATIQDGNPLIINDSAGGAIYGLAGSPALVLSRAQMAPGMTYADIATKGSDNQRLGGASGEPGWFNKAAFTSIPSADPRCAPSVCSGWGNSGIGPILGPGQFNFDVALVKETRVGGVREDAQLQFRAEFFNVFNHPQFGNPVTGPGNGSNVSNDIQQGNFGQITNLSVNPRLVQLALKYTF